VKLIKKEVSSPHKQNLLLIKEGENNRRENKRVDNSHVKNDKSNNNRGESNCMEYIVNKPTIFTKKSKIVVVKPLTYINSDTGKTRHFTPAAQE
jgi:FtsZ-interacting cell division protein YlmF